MLYFFKEFLERVSINRLILKEKVERKRIKNENRNFKRGKGEL